jgi:hypothetical protein
MPNCANCMSFISLQLVFPKVALILKTFTFAPYCYPYASLGAALLTRFSTLNLRLPPILTRWRRSFMLSGSVPGQFINRPGESRHAAIVRYSNRKISTGRILDAERAGSTVAAMLIASAAAAIHKASNPLA